jgi:hypothetical protein
MSIRDTSVIAALRSRAISAAPHSFLERAVRARDSVRSSSVASVTGQRSNARHGKPTCPADGAVPNRIRFDCPSIQMRIAAALRQSQQLTCRPRDYFTGNYAAV